MKNRYIKFLTVISLAIFVFGQGWSQNYLAVNKQGNVYDEASAKYITTNQNNDDVTVVEGMVFPYLEHQPGWYKIEYSPGLHAFLPEQIVASGFKPVQSGTYELKNQPGKKIDIQGNGEDWKAVVDGKDYKGKKWEDILIFTDQSNNIAFSLVDLGNGPIAITYDNSVTKFF